MSRRAIDWPAAAARLAAAIPTSRLRPEVLAWARSRPPREGWAAAFSGGADSLCLLLLLWAHWPERRSRLRALHFNHRLRGAASAADARFCGRVCRALGIGFSAGSWSGARPEASAAAARSARFAFIDREMRRRRLRALWLGHQQDDVAETQLMRLARGSGTAGLAAPRPVQDGPSGRRHLRPLLDLKKREIAGARRRRGSPGGRTRATPVRGISGTGSAGPSFRPGSGPPPGTRSPEPRFRGSSWRRTTGRSRPGLTPSGPRPRRGICRSPGSRESPGRSSGGRFTAGSWPSTQHVPLLVHPLE